MKFIISALLLLGSTCLPAVAQETWVTTCTKDPYSSANLRRGPGRNYGIVASVPNGTYVRPLSWVWGADNMRWYRIESGGLVGYTRSDYLCR